MLVWVETCLIDDHRRNFSQIFHGEAVPALRNVIYMMDFLPVEDGQQIREQSRPFFGRLTEVARVLPR